MQHHFRKLDFTNSMKKTFSIDGNKDLMVLTLVYIESVNLGALFFRYAIILWDGSLHFLKWMFIHLQFTGSCFDVEHYWLRNAVRSRCLSYLPCDGVHVDTSFMSGICTNMRRWTFKNRKSVNRWFFALKSILKLITVDWHHFIIRWAGYCTYECKTM